MTIPPFASLLHRRRRVTKRRVSRVLRQLRIDLVRRLGAHDWWRDDVEPPREIAASRAWRSAP